MRVLLSFVAFLFVYVPLSSLFRLSELITTNSWEPAGSSCFAVRVANIACFRERRPS
jgi:hypothetical protein